MSLAEIVKKKKNYNYDDGIDSNYLVMNTEKFKRIGKKIHGDDFIYNDETIYVDKKTKIKVLCKESHECLVTFRVHIVDKHKCYKCSIKNTGKLLMERVKINFIERVKKIHGENTYDYSEVDYQGTLKNVKIKCNKGHEFLITPNMHLDGQGCKYCNEELKKEGKTTNKIVERTNKKWTQELFIQESKRIHKDKFDYSLTEFININQNVILKCVKYGHIINTSPQSHLAGANCIKCTHIMMENEDFIKKSKKIFGENTFDYSKLEYKGYFSKIILICKEKNHEYETTPKGHYRSLGCLLCKNTSEIKLFDKLKTLYENLSFQRYFKNVNAIKTYPFDFCLEELKIIIELDGEQHFKKIEFFKDNNVEERQRVDFLKMFEVSKLGYSIIRIFQPNILIKSFDWVSLINESINYIRENNKPCVITIEKDNLVYENYKNNYYNFLLSKSYYLDEDYYLSIVKISKNNYEIINREYDYYLDEYIVPDEDDF